MISFALLLLISGKASSQDVAEAYARDGFVKLYRSCLDKNVTRLDDGHQTVEAITRAVMFACSAEHDAVKATARSAIQNEMSKHDPSLNNDAAFDTSDAATAQLKIAMDGFDKASGDRIAYLILNKRSK